MLREERKSGETKEETTAAGTSPTTESTANPHAYYNAQVVFTICVSLLELAQSAIKCDELESGSGTDCDDKNYSWAVAAGAGSFFICLFILASPFPSTQNETAVAFLFGWWMFFVSVLTFRNPYTEVGNGYLFSWAAFLGAGNVFNETFFSIAAGSEVSTIIITSSYVFAEAYMDMNDEPEPKNIEWALAVPATSVAICLYILIKAKLCGLLECELKVVSVLLMACWSAGAGMLTFQHPYTTVGNAYFGIWLSFAMAVKMVATVVLDLHCESGGSRQSSSREVFQRMVSVRPAASDNVQMLQVKVDSGNDEENQKDPDRHAPSTPPPKNVERPRSADEKAAGEQEPAAPPAAVVDETAAPLTAE